MDTVRLNEREFHHMLLVAAVLGVGVGLVATGFRLVWLFVKHHLWEALAAPYWRVPVSVVAGILIGAILYATFYPGALSTLVQQFHAEGRVELEENVPIIPVGLVGLVAGQNAGPEGVMSVVGGSFGTYVSELFEFENSTKLLTLAGMGAGFGAILGAPIGGALLWLELPHERGLEYYEAIVPTFVASFAGYLTEVTLGGMELFPAWRTASIMPLTPAQLGWAVAVGLLCIPFGLVYSKTFSAIGRLFRRLSLAVYVRTTLAGGVIGVLGWLVPLSYFYGGSKMNVLLERGASLGPEGLMLTLAAVMVAAGFTIHGNWIGGLIIPHMFMGALVGQAAALVVPGLSPVLATLAGMAAFNSVVTGTPLSSALIAIALTDGASITPVFLASLVAFGASPSVRFLDEAAPRSESPNFHISDD
ncbi:chloride channel protein [Halopelagius longus]|uniref:Chloride channel protein n=1 Tax=Halopelagius longus TaxID=1236180 RepID=A0A1H1B6G5_9EURY|nr:chloride channel protein [Halopelagius longus]RDI70645.1 chloride channel protein [Halopelagius longus]SDQ46996.1 H+/Cl-antiporter ClcA [Halopelagius longus]